MSNANLKARLERALEKGQEPFHSVVIDDVAITGVTYRQWLIGQLLLGVAPPIWQSRFDNERVAESIVSLVDAIIKRERQA